MFYVENQNKALYGPFDSNIVAESFGSEHFPADFITHHGIEEDGDYIITSSPGVVLDKEFIRKPLEPRPRWKYIVNGINCFGGVVYNGSGEGFMRDINAAKRAEGVVRVTVDIALPQC